MPLPLIGLGIAAGAGLLGQLLANKSREEAAAILAQVRDEYGRIDPAKVEKLAAERVEIDGQYDGAMRDSLGRVDEQIAQGGMTIADRAALNEALDTTGRQERAQRAHIMRSFEDRGAGGSGQALLASLVNQQGAAQRAHGAGLETAAEAQRRYWQAVRDRFNMGAQGAEQRSAIDRWNATNRQDTARYNNSLEQQRFNNDMAKVGGKAGVAGAQVTQANADADRTAGAYANYGAAAGDAFAQYDADEQRKKKNGYAV
jgi:hypothetical protein